MPQADNEASPLSPPCAVSEMRAIADSHCRRESKEPEMAKVMAGVLAYLAESLAARGVDQQSLDAVVREWNLRDEYPRCPDCRGLAVDEDRSDGSIKRTCYEGCGYEEAI